MKKSYLDSYYPDGISAEQRLFNAGARCTRVSLPTWLKTIGIGIAISIFGLIISSIDYELFEFGMVVFYAGDLAVTIGIIGLFVYLTGLHYLERAELLYNTRLAGKEEQDITDSDPTPNSASQHATTTKQTPPTQTIQKWVCTCGKENADYTSVCSCGVTKQQAKTAVPSATKPVRTANGWKCSCGREHPVYVSSCTCGVSKTEIQ